MRLAIMLIASLTALPLLAGEPEVQFPIEGRWAMSEATCKTNDDDVNGVLTIRWHQITQGEWHCKVKGGIRTQTKWVARVECGYEESDNEPHVAQIEFESANGVLHMVYAPFTDFRREEYFAFRCDR